MVLRRKVGLPGLAAAAALLIGAAPAQTSAPTGLWRNPRGTVVVRTEPCSDKLCGTVVWAAPEAIADAREGGHPQLIGTELLRNYRRDGPGHWTGIVFIPDMDRSFYSTIRQLAPDRLEVSGCILHGLLCKRQEWRRP
jgi:uncharacterized protein (DUF2147 family)